MIDYYHWIVRQKSTGKIYHVVTDGGHVVDLEGALYSSNLGEVEYELFHQEYYPTVVLELTFPGKLS